jgi:hypothetical protein
MLEMRALQNTESTVLRATWRQHRDALIKLEVVDLARILVDVFCYTVRERTGFAQG